MAGLRVTVAQQKGGAGKTTLAAHLAVAFGQMGKSVATVDIDPQASLTRWIEARNQGRDTADIAHVRIKGWQASSAIDRMAQAHDVVVVDSPPHMETEAKIAVRGADLVIVPVQPSPMDFWATEPTLTMAKAEGRRVLLVVNRVPPRAKLADALIDRVGELGAEVAETRIGNRVGLAAALMEGRAVTETASRTRAAQEIRALAEEILAKV